MAFEKYQEVFHLSQTPEVKMINTYKMRQSLPKRKSVLHRDCSET